MDDLTLLNSLINDTEAIFNKWSKLVNWACMKFKAKKSRSLVLKKEKVEEKYHFELGEEKI